MSILCTIVLVASCNQKTTSSSSARSTDMCEWNDSKEYALCSSEIKNGNNSSSTSFKILDKDGKIVKEGTISNGNAKWISNDAVEIAKAKEMENEDEYEVYLVSTGETMTKREYLKKNKFQIEVGDIEYIKQDLDPDACLIDAKLVSLEGTIAVVEISDVKVCRTVTSEPQKGQLYKMDVSGQDLTVGSNYTLEVSVPAESKGNKLFLLKVKE